MVTDLVEGSGASFAVVEMPPGPPVLQSVVAEVHGPDPETRRQVARDLTEIFRQTESLRDVDNYMREPYDYWHFEVDNEKAQRRGISTEAINRELSMALGGFVLGDVKQRAGHEPINIVIQVPLAERSQINRLGDILVLSPTTGVGVPLRELGTFERRTEDHIIYNKDLRPVEYVVADVGGRLAAPIYGMLQVEQKLEELGCETPDGVVLCDHIYYTGPPPDDSVSSFEWAGEWTVTYETFRDMGIAFGAALVLIYILVVWEFSNFRIPGLIMAPIPLTLLGIIPAHMLFFQMGWGGEFTATSMIGWIALAGIIVRNSILLVDFSVHRIQEGDSVVDAVITACKTRTRPILITALALVAGSSVIFFDPIFQGMAISLASGVLVSTILTLIVIPLGCVAAADSLCAVAGSSKCRKFSRGGPGDDPDGGPEGGGPQGPKGGPRVGDPLWVRAWGGFASVLFTVIGGAVAIVTLISGLFKRRPKPTPAAAARQGPKTAAPPATPAPAAESHTEPAGRAAATDTAVVAATPARASAPSAKSARAEPAAAKKRPAKKKAAAVSRATQTGHAKQAAASSAAAQEKGASEPSSTPAPSAVAKPKPKPAERAKPKKKVVAKKTTAKKAAKKAPAKTKSAASAPAPKTKPAKAAAKPTRKGPDLTVVPKPEPAVEGGDAKSSTAGRKKSAGRRGIQLKSLGKSGGDGLN
jgi:hypothetical protein